MISRRATPLALVPAAVAFALLFPLTCTGRQDRAREFCETAYRWKLPWSSIQGPMGTALMYGLPIVIAIAVFLIARTILQGSGEGAARERDATSRS
jgi:hypothetical protein